MKNVVSRIARFVCGCAVLFVLTGCSGGLAGSTYEAKSPDEDATMTLTFVDGEECKLAMGGAIGKMEFTTKYTVEGDTVKIQSPLGEDDPLVLKRSGSTLEGDMDGENVKFVKK